MSNQKGNNRLERPAYGGDGADRFWVTNEGPPRQDEGAPFSKKEVRSPR